MRRIEDRLDWLENQDRRGTNVATLVTVLLSLAICAVWWLIANH
jgi:hypothetical protein